MRYEIEYFYKRFNIWCRFGYESVYTLLESEQDLSHIMNSSNYYNLNNIRIVIKNEI